MFCFHLCEALVSTRRALGWKGNPVVDVAYYDIVFVVVQRLGGGGG